MSAIRPVWVLRPEPGNAATCERLSAMGRTAVSLPLFTVEPLAWEVPAAVDYDALLLTSANAVSHAGAGLSRLSALPVYAVGEATAAAARAAGLSVSATGSGGVEGIAPLLARDQRRRILHLTGHDFRALAIDAEVTVRHVYAAQTRADSAILPALSAAPRPADVLLHSPRAAKRFAELVDKAGLARKDLCLYTLSHTIAAAAGPDWAAVTIAERMDEAALLSCLQK